MKILHLTLGMFLHYFVKRENYNCCRFQWHMHAYLFESGSVAHINIKEKHYIYKTCNRYDQIQKQRK